MIFSSGAASIGALNTTRTRPADILKAAILSNALGLVLIHNHPSGDPTPSQADIAMTRDIVRAGEAMGVAIHDHLIVGRDGHVSLKALGLF